MSNRVAPTPPKSWIVRGLAAVATRGPAVIQCGETTSTASGRGSSRPSAVSCGPAVPGSSANVGAPWEMKRLGSRLMSRGLREWRPPRGRLQSGIRDQAVHGSLSTTVEEERDRGRQQRKGELIAVVGHEKSTLEMHGKNCDQHRECKGRRCRSHQEPENERQAAEELRAARE